MRSWRKNKFSNTHHCCRHFKPGTTGIFHLHNCSGSRPMLPVGKKQQQQQRGTADVRDMSVFLLFLRVCVWWIDPHLRYLPLCYTLYIDSIHLKVICICVLLLLVSSTMPAGVWAFKSVFLCFVTEVSECERATPPSVWEYASVNLWELSDGFYVCLVLEIPNTTLRTTTTHAFSI